MLRQRSASAAKLHGPRSPQKNKLTCHRRLESTSDLFKEEIHSPHVTDVLAFHNSNEK